MKVIRWQELQVLIGVSRATVWRWEKEGRFPRRRHLGPNSVGWLQEEVENWIQTREAVGAPGF